MKLGVGLYIVPLAFIVNPFLIKPDTHFSFALLSFVKIALGLWLLSNALVNDKQKTSIRIIFAILALIIVFIPFQ